MRTAIQTFQPKAYYWAIPTSINLPQVLKDNPPCFRYRIDYFYYILDAICNKMEYFDLDSKEEQWVRLNASRLQGIKYDYKNYLSYLVEQNIIIHDKIYVVGKHSMGYRINNKYFDGDVKEIEIDPANISLKRKLTGEKASTKINEQSEGYAHLTKWFNDKLKIDKEAAISMVEELYPIIRYDRYYEKNILGRFKALRAVHKLSRSEFSYKVDDNIGRFHSNLTNIKKDLRKCLTYDGQKLVNLDIKNSQPLLSGILLKEEFYKEGEIYSIHSIKSINNVLNEGQFNNILISIISYYIMIVDSPEHQAHKEFEHFLSIIQGGTFYEEIWKLFYPNMALTSKLRNHIKTTVLRLFFSDNKHGPELKRFGKPFKAHFPNVYRVFSLLKRCNKRLLSHILQKTESHLIIEIITKRIAAERPELPIFTVHDSIATTLGNEDYVAGVMREEIKKLTGLNASIGKEPWYEIDYEPATLNTFLVAA